MSKFFLETLIFTISIRQKHKDQRRLTWLYQMSVVEIKTNKTPKIQLLTVTTYQTAILLAFNHREHMSVKEMQDHTDLDTKEVHKVRIAF
jgi:hypothetical protein